MYREMECTSNVFRTEPLYKRNAPLKEKGEASRSSFIVLLSQELRRQGCGTEAVKHWIEAIASRIHFCPCKEVVNETVQHFVSLSSQDSASKSRIKDSNGIIVVQLDLSSLNLTTTVTYSLCEALIRATRILSDRINEDLPFMTCEAIPPPCEVWSLTLAHNSLGDECLPPLLALLEKKKRQWCACPRRAKEEEATSIAGDTAGTKIWLDIFTGNRFSPSGVSSLVNMLERIGSQSYVHLSARDDSGASFIAVTPVKMSLANGLEMQETTRADPYLFLGKPARIHAVDRDSSLHLPNDEGSPTSSSVDWLPRSNSNVQQDFRQRALMLLFPNPLLPQDSKGSSPSNMKSSPLGTQATHHVPDGFIATIEDLDRTSKRAVLNKTLMVNRALQEIVVRSPSPKEVDVVATAHATDERAREACACLGWRSESEVQSSTKNDPSSRSDGKMQNGVPSSHFRKSESTSVMASVATTSLRDGSDDALLPHHYHSAWIKGGVVDLSGITIDTPSSHLKGKTQNQLPGWDTTEERGIGLLNPSSTEHFSALYAKYDRLQQRPIENECDDVPVQSSAYLGCGKKGGNSRQSVWDVLAFLQEHHPVARESKWTRTSSPVLQSLSISSGLLAMTVLDLSHNGLNSIPTGALPPTLLRLDLSHNELLWMENGAWLKPCRMLAVLNLRYNRLGYLKKPVAASVRAQSDRRGKNILLDDKEHENEEKEKSHGGAGTFDFSSPLSGALEHTPHLTHLFLGHNYLVSLDGICVSLLLSLHTLDVSYNRFANLNLLRPLSLCTSLYQLILKGNPLPFPSADVSASKKRPSESRTLASTYMDGSQRMPYSQNTTKIAPSSFSASEAHSPSFKASHLRPVLRNMLPRLVFVDDILLQNSNSDLWKAEEHDPIVKLKSDGLLNGPSATSGSTFSMDYKKKSSENARKIKGESYTFDEPLEEQEGVVISKTRTVRSTGSSAVVGLDERDAYAEGSKLHSPDSGIWRTTGSYSSPQHEHLQHRALLRIFHLKNKKTNGEREVSLSLQADGCAGYQETEKAEQHTSLRQSCDPAEKMPKKKYTGTLLNELEEKPVSFKNRLSQPSPIKRGDSPSPSRESLLRHLDIFSETKRSLGNTAGNSAEKGNGTDTKGDLPTREYEAVHRPVVPSQHLPSTPGCEKWLGRLAKDRKEVKAIILDILELIEKQQSRFLNALKNDSSAFRMMISFFKNRPKYRSCILHERMSMLEDCYQKGAGGTSSLHETSRSNCLLAPTVIPKFTIPLLQQEGSQAGATSEKRSPLADQDFAHASGEDLRTVLFACEDAKACLRFLLRLVQDSTSLLRKLDSTPGDVARRKSSTHVNRENLFRMVADIEIQLFSSHEGIRHVIEPN